MKKTILATSLSIILTACGGGSEEDPGLTAVSSVVIPFLPAENLPWALTKIASAGSVQSDAKSCGSYDIVTKGDLNNDGHEDVVIGPKARYQPANGCSDPGFTRPIVAYYDPLTKTFKSNPATHSVIPEMQWMQAATVGDFNNDGFADLFAVGTGTDYGQPCGEAPILMLGSATGLVNASHLLPRFSMYSHQATWGDFNGDGKTDFVILNNNWVPDPMAPKAAECSYQKFPGSNDSYIVLSAGNAWTYSALTVADKLGKNVIDGNQSFNSVGSGDINSDGKLDLVVAGGNWGSLQQQTLVLLGNGQGKFTADSVLVEKPFGDATVSVGVSIKQLDSGNPEVVVNYTEHPGGQAMPFQKSLYRIFSYNSVLNNVTDQYLTNKNSLETDLTFCARFYWADLNADSRDDFVCTTVNHMKYDDTSLTSPRFWLRTDSGKFEPAYHRGISLVNKMASPTPVKVDGKIKVVGLGTNSYGSAIQLDLAE